MARRGKLQGALLGAGLVVAALAVRGVVSRPSPASRAAPAELEELKTELAALRTRVGGAEAVGAAAFARSRPAAAPAEDETPSLDSTVERAAKLVPPDLVAEQTRQLERFHGYFESLDALRGPGNDEQLSGRLEKVIASHAWDGAGGAPPTEKSVACGNGFCRLTLTFTDENAADAARQTFPLSLVAVAPSLSLFMDPDTARVEAYVAMNDKTLPPFPMTNP